MARLTDLGRALGAWQSEEDFFFPELRALAEAVSDLGPHVDWSRPAHLLFLDSKLLAGSLALALPARDPERALVALAEVCRGSSRGGAWHFKGGGAGLMPCRFHVRPVPGGMLVSSSRILVDALARYGHALLDPRLDVSGASPRSGSAGAAKVASAGRGAGREGSGAAAPLVELKAFVPALRARFGIDASKVAKWLDLLAMGLAMAAGDFTAAGDLKEDLGRLVTQLDSLQDAGLTLGLGSDGLELRLFATGSPGGALARWVRARGPLPLELHRRLEPRAAVSLALVGPASRASSPSLASRAHGKADAAGAAAATRAFSRPALAPLVDLLLPKLPKAFRLPARKLWDVLTGPGSGELALALRRTGERELGLELLLHHGQARRARRDLLDAGLALAGALRERLGGASALSEKAHREEAMDRVELTFGKGLAAGALSFLAGSSQFGLAVSHRGNVVALVFGAGAEERARDLLANGPQQGPGAAPPGGRPDSTSGAAPEGVLKAPEPPLPMEGVLGRVTLSLVELGCLALGSSAPEAGPTRDSGSLLLEWGVLPERRRVQVRLSLPGAHLKAALPMLQAISERIEGAADSLGGLMGVDEEAEDAL
jgi:hypothetical protein